MSIKTCGNLPLYMLASVNKYVMILGVGALS